MKPYKGCRALVMVGMVSLAVLTILGAVRASCDLLEGDLDAQSPSVHQEAPLPGESGARLPPGVSYSR